MIIPIELQMIMFLWCLYYGSYSYDRSIRVKSLWNLVGKKTVRSARRSEPRAVESSLVAPRSLVIKQCYRQVIFP